jgi:serine/threonine protein kinase
VPGRQIHTSDTIAGYTLTERIGCGGYGEVWSAEAPGGLKKAVKIIYGFHDEERAERERKALDRIKQVRHPFLLSLERIEVVDGQLIVVSELADGSLKDRFDRCLSEKMQGIPRDELIGYMKDAAEALDYISENHSLQHLDVKPENLLMVVGHVKVADFGLVKEIEDSSASLMGGLTPIYAAPELFDGRPCQYSDQYSLAIVYQEMLTGIRPFVGNTAAQLMVQHLKNRPKLSPLPRADQAIIGRALAKDPARRFPSCRAMVEGLLKSDELVTHLKPKGGDRPPRQPSDTELVTPSDLQAQPTELMRNISQESLSSVGRLPALRQTSTEVKNLPPLEWNPEAARCGATLFVGIGHTGTRILAKLKRRLSQRLGASKEIPAIRLLCIDSDRRELLEATRGEDGTALALDETLAMPLRTPEEYRDDGKRHLAWLSRRWLYNIPRNLQTEGIRPLGRLAFADHAPALLERFHTLIRDMTSKDSVEATAKATRLPKADGVVRVFVVASISGGVGSGMVLDLAYAVRKTLADLRLPDDYVCGVLTHSARHLGSRRDLAIANTCACLTELYHYSGAHGYPGDAAQGLPPFQDNRPTFSDTYVVHLGEDLPAEEFEAATDHLAEYLFLSSVTPCAAALDACREQTVTGSDSFSDKFHLRTVGLTQIGCAAGELPSLAANLLCRSVVGLWTERPQGALGAANANLGAADGLDIDRLVEERTAELGVTTDGLTNLVQQALREEWGAPLEEHLANSLQQVVAKADPGPEWDRAQLGKLLERLEAALGVIAASQEGQARWQKELNKLAELSCNKLAAAIVTLIDNPQVRIHGAERAGETTRAMLLELQNHTTGELNKIRPELRQLHHEFSNNGSSDRTQSKLRFRKSRGGEALPKEEAAQHLARYARLRKDEFLLASVIKLASLISSQLSKVAQQLLEMRREVVKMAKLFSIPPAEDAGPRSGDDQTHDAHSELANTLRDVLLAQLPALAAQFDRELQKGYLQDHGGLSHILTPGAPELQDLPEILQAMARDLVLGAMKQMDVATIMLNTDSGPVNAEDRLREQLAAARPRLLDCGGAMRLLLLVPSGQSSERLSGFMAEKLKQQTSVVPGSWGDLVFCYEVEQVPLANVAVKLLENRAERAKYAARLHTRVDVPWPDIAEIN